MNRTLSRPFQTLLTLLCLPMLGSCGILIQQGETIPRVIHRTVAPGDVLRVRDLDAPEPPLAVMTVDAFGDVLVPDLGTSLSVSGYTAEDVEAVLASFSNHPNRRLQVEVLPPRSRYWMYGEVGEGGRRALRPGTTVSEAVRLADPHGGRADLGRVRVLRGRQDPRELVVDVTDPQQDVELLDGDVLVVPPRGAGNMTTVGLK
jgi:protein involved in polysaccharide export with SLBB domain